MYFDRAVSVECEGRVGAGCVVAPGLVLTAFHVVRSPELPTASTRDTIRVRLLSNTVDTAVAEVAWSGISAGVDAALLRFKPADLDQVFAPVRWGELTCTSPEPAPRCFAVGLPQAAVRSVANPAGGPVESWREPEAAEGHINVADNASRLYSLQVTSATSSDGTESWRGMSGAGLIHRDFLLGVVRTAVPDRRNRRLEAVPARELLNDRAFCDVVERACGTRPLLEPADLDKLFHDVPAPAPAPSYLLAARAETVPFTGLDNEMQRALDWCRDPDPKMLVGVGVVEGVGGVGKTRLATELARRLSDRSPHSEVGEHRPWSAGFLADELDPAVYALLPYLIRPLLVIVDYADSRMGQVDQLLRALASHRSPGRPVRILLLTRSAAPWWRPWCARNPARATAPQTLQLTPQSLLRQVSAADLRDQADLAFAKRLHELRQGSDAPDLGDPGPFVEPSDPDVELAYGPARAIDTEEADVDGGILGVHMESLAHVLLNSPEAEHLDAMDVLLGHEETHWRRAAVAAGLPVASLDYLRVLVVVQRLVGAQDKREAEQALLAAWDAGIDAPSLDSVRSALLKTLGALYPPTGGTYWGGLGPDALVAGLVSSLEEQVEEDFFAQVLASDRLSPWQHHHCLSMMSRHFDAPPYLMESAAAAVHLRPDLLLPHAQVLMEVLPPQTAQRWQEALDDENPWLLRDHTQYSPPVKTAPPRTAPPPPLPAIHRPSPPKVLSPPLSQPRPQPGPALAPAPAPAPAPARTVPRRARDYLGFDAHGWRLIATIAVIALVLGAGGVAVWWLLS